MTDDRQGRVVNLVLWVSAVLTAGSVIMLLVALPRIFDTSTNSRAVREMSELSSCRSRFFAEVQAADDALDEERATREDLVLLGLVASARGDASSLARLADEAPVTLERIAAARDVKSAAVARYQAASDLSFSDPERFLVDCKDEP